MEPGKLVDLLPYHHHAGRSLSISQTPKGSTTILIVEEERPTLSLRKNWKFLLVALWLLACNTLTGVADQQLSKEVNSPAFTAPFFYLWYMGFIRIFTFLVYLPLRLLYDRIRGRQSGYHLENESQTPSSRSHVLKNVLTSAKAIYRYDRMGAPFWSQRNIVLKPDVTDQFSREAELVFGPAGLTRRTGLLYLIPFALVWTGTNGLFYLALTFGEVSECVAISSSSIIFINVISWFCLKEKFMLFKVRSFLLMFLS